MKFATYDDGSTDGRLYVVSSEHARAIDASAIAPSLLSVLQNWREVEAPLKRLSEDLDANHSPVAVVFDPRLCLAPGIPGSKRPSTRMNSILQGVPDRFAQAWFVPRWMTTSPSRKSLSPLSRISVISPEITTP